MRTVATSRGPARAVPALLASLLLAAGCSADNNDIRFAGVPYAPADTSGGDTIVTPDVTNPRDTSDAGRDPAPEDTRPADTSEDTRVDPADAGNDADPQDAAEDAPPQDTGPDDVREDTGPGDTGPEDSGPHDVTPVDVTDTTLSDVRDIGPDADAGRDVGPELDVAPELDTRPDTRCQQLFQSCSGPEDSNETYVCADPPEPTLGRSCLARCSDFEVGGATDDCPPANICTRLVSGGIQEGVCLPVNCDGLRRNSESCPGGTCMFGFDGQGVCMPDGMAQVGTPCDPMPTWTTDDPLGTVCMTGLACRDEVCVPYCEESQLGDPCNFPNGGDCRELVPGQGEDSYGLCVNDCHWFGPPGQCPWGVCRALNAREGRCEVRLEVQLLEEGEPCIDGDRSAVCDQGLACIETGAPDNARTCQRLCASDGSFSEAACRANEVCVPASTPEIGLGVCRLSCEPFPRRGGIGAYPDCPDDMQCELVVPLGPTVESPAIGYCSGREGPDIGQPCETPGTLTCNDSNGCLGNLEAGETPVCHEVCQPFTNTPCRTPDTVCGVGLSIQGYAFSFCEPYGDHPTTGLCSTPGLACAENDTTCIDTGLSGLQCLRICRMAVPGDCTDGLRCMNVFDPNQIPTWIGVCLPG